MKSNSDIDSFFKHKLADPVDETAYREEDWDALEKMMDKGKRRGIIYWLPLLSGVAALVLIVLGWWLFKPETDNQQNTQTQIAKTSKHNQQQQVDSINKNTTTGTIPALVAAPQPKNRTEQQMPKNNHVNTPPQITFVERKADAPVAGNDQQNMPQPTAKEQPVANATALPIAGNVVAGTDTTKAVLAANNPAPLPEQRNTDMPEKGMAAAAKTKKVNDGSSIFGRPQFALTIMGAPDINGVNSFSQSKAGTNIGLLFSASFNKLTVSTGVAYSVKPYRIAYANNSYGNYYFGTDPTSVLADCRMLDIPFNVDYQFFNKNQNKISIGTGLSSYIMLQENYTYQYANPGTLGPRGYSIASPGKYFFGIVNLQATYKRQINSKVGLSLQPYLKLPLGDVGASKVRLQSAGVALGVSWSINQLKKP
jgi:cytoskeletal protein RodZ